MATGEPDRHRYFPWLAGAIVLVLIGGILVLTLRPVAGDPSASRRPLSQGERKAKRIERRLAEMQGGGIEMAAIQAWSDAGSRRLSKLEFETQRIPPAVREDFEAGVRIWDRYLKQTGGKAGADIAELAGSLSFQLAEIGSHDLGEIEVDLARAARAVQIAGRHRPTLFTLSNVAVYAYFNGEFARGDIAARGAAAAYHGPRRYIVVEQLEGYRGRAEVFRRLFRQARAELRESDDELLAEPLKVYSDSVSLNKDDPTE